MTALALRDDQTYWDEAQIAVLRSTGIDDDVTKPELSAFLHECQRRKLDPFTRQIYLIGRYDRQKKRKVYRSQTSIDGFRLIARRAADRSGIDYAYEDTIWFDANGQRHEVWLSQQPPSAAKVVVVRNGNRYDAVARFSSYVQVDRDGNALGQWRNMPDVMIAKCAEALALRKAFPEDLGGIYTDEEMAQADNPQTVRVEVVRDEHITAPRDVDEPELADEAAAARATVTDTEWLRTASAEASTFADAGAGRALWRKVAAKVKAGECAEGDAKHLGELIQARIEDLGREAETVRPSAVHSPLDPEDPWAPAVDAIESQDDADRLLADLKQQFAEHAEGLDETRVNRIRAAVLAKAAGFGKAAA